MKHSKWTPDNILEKLRELHGAGCDLAYTQLARSAQPLLSAAAYHYGSYPKAVVAAGIDYAEVTRRPHWTRQRIIATIKAARRNGEDVNWGAVIARRDELGKAAFASLQKRLFGSWQRALSAAGLDAEEISPYRRWDAASIVRELRSRHREGQPLNSGALQRDDPGLHAAAFRLFGSYDDALRKARIDPSEVRRNRSWTREAVIRELRALHRKHHQLTTPLVRAVSPALYGAAVREFKNLGAALIAALGQ